LERSLGKVEKKKKWLKKHSEQDDDQFDVQVK
jgi:hypothetical protein